MEQYPALSKCDSVETAQVSCPAVELVVAAGYSALSYQTSRLLVVAVTAVDSYSFRNHQIVRLLAVVAAAAHYCCRILHFLAAAARSDLDYQRGHSLAAAEVVLAWRSRKHLQSAEAAIALKSQIARRFAEVAIALKSQIFLHSAVYSLPYYRTLHLMVEAGTLMYLYSENQRDWVSSD